MFIKSAWIVALVVSSPVALAQSTGTFDPSGGVSGSWNGSVNTIQLQNGTYLPVDGVCGESGHNPWSLHMKIWQTKYWSSGNLITVAPILVKDFGSLGITTTAQVWYGGTGGMNNAAGGWILTAWFASIGTAHPYGEYALITYAGASAGTEVQDAEQVWDYIPSDTVSGGTGFSPSDSSNLSDLDSQTIANGAQAHSDASAIQSAITDQNVNNTSWWGSLLSGLFEPSSGDMDTFMADMQSLASWGPFGMLGQFASDAALWLGSPPDTGLVFTLPWFVYANGDPSSLSLDLSGYATPIAFVRTLEAIGLWVGAFLMLSKRVLQNV